MTRPKNSKEPTSVHLDEFDLIEELFAPLAATAPLAFGLTDDAALFQPVPGHELVLTKDMIVAGVHFFADDPPDLIARKLLRVNLSDLAAKGARPCGYLLGAAFPDKTSLDWMRAFAEGLAADQAEFGIALWGGDTVRTPGPAVFSVTAMGEVAAGKLVRRAGARVGDGLYVTGTVGDGALGLKTARGEIAGMAAADADFLLGRYRLPLPRVAFGLRLAGFATACLDVSDGLAADLGHLCDVSNVGARLEAALLPLSPPAARALAADPGLMMAILTGGDDYELLFAAPADRADEIAHAARETATPVRRIGEVRDAAERLRVLNPDGAELTLEPTGYRHF